MTSPSINWDDMRIFLEISRTGRLSRAAQRLKMDQATVSRRLQRLESRLGVRLFERSRHGHKLTEAGHDLRPLAEQAEAAALAAKETLSGADQALSGTIRVNVAEGFGTYFVAPRLPEFTTAHPDIEIELVASTSFLSASQRETDIAVHLSRPSAGNLVTSKLTDYHLRLYASAAYCAAHPPVRSLDDLAGHTLVGYIDDLIYAPELRYLAPIVRNQPVRVRSTSIVAQYHAVRNGVGICILPCFMAHQDPDLVLLLEEDIVIKRSFWLLYSADLRHIARIRAFADFLHKIVQRDKGLLLGTS